MKQITAVHTQTFYPTSFPYYNACFIIKRTFPRTYGTLNAKVITNTKAPTKK